MESKVEDFAFEVEDDVPLSPSYKKLLMSNEVIDVETSDESPQKPANAPPAAVGGETKVKKQETPPKKRSKEEEEAKFKSAKGELEEGEGAKAPPAKRPKVKAAALLETSSEDETPAPCSVCRFFVISNLMNKAIRNKSVELFQKRVFRGA